MVVSIILGILKVIGIILLCILGLLLLFFLSVLFVPFRYKIYAGGNVDDADKSCHVMAKISWLIFTICAKYAYPSEDGPIIKLGPFTLYGGKEKPKKEKKVKKKKRKKEDDLPDETKQDEDLNSEEALDEAMDDSTDDAGDETENDTSEQKERKTLKEKILYTRQKIYDRINGIIKKIKYILANIHKYMDIIKSEEFKNIFQLCKKSIFRMIRMVKPRKLRIKGNIGLSSPDQTGYVCAAVGVISPYYKKQIQITPDFEKFIINGNILIKGRAYGIVFMIIGIKFLVNKNLRKLIKMIRKEVVINE